MWPRRRKDRFQTGEVDGRPTAPPVFRVMGYADLDECWLLDQRCFVDGEAYDRETFRYLLSHTQSICYKVVTSSGEMAAFVVGMVEPDSTGHIVAIGVDPLYRRQGFARRLMEIVERRFVDRRVSTVRLEVRTTNAAAQNLYFELGYKIVRRMPRYYTSGDDGFLMIKDLD